MQDFWDYLHKSDTNLAHIEFSVFGIGNKNYNATYQAVFRYVVPRLKELGAIEFVESKEGDVGDPSEFDEIFDAWVQTIKL